MARTIRQALPQPPPAYDQAYLAQLADAINYYMFQREAPGDLTAARFICVDPITIPNTVPDTTGLPTGMLNLQYAFADTADSSIAQQAYATVSITLTTTSTPIPGTSLTLTRTGNYFFFAHFDFTIANEQGALIHGTITGATHSVVVDSASKSGRTPANMGAVAAVTSVPLTVQLIAYKDSGSGNSSTGLNSNLIAIWVAGPSSPDASGTGTAFFTIVTPQDKK
jgi:hypothetical protein